MRKGFVLGIAACFILGMVGIASATGYQKPLCPPEGCPDGEFVFTYFDDTNVSFDGAGDAKTWSYDIKAEYPSVKTVTSANLQIKVNADSNFIDWLLLPEYANLSFDLDPIWNPKEVDNFTYSFDVTDYLADLKLDVIISWVDSKICFSPGDFVIDFVKLEGCYQPVPEPATMLLLGSGLIGLALYGRKRNQV